MIECKNCGRFISPDNGYCDYCGQKISDEDIQAYQQKKMIDLDFEKQMAQIRLMELQSKIQIEAPKEEKEFQQEVYLEGIKNINMSDLTQLKETAKDERTKLQATQQSKMIDQRKGQKPPIDFKSEDNHEVNPFKLDTP